MKKTTLHSVLVTALSGLLAILMMGSAQAALVDRGGGLIFDSDQNVTWIQNPFLVISSPVDFDRADFRISNYVYNDSLRSTSWDDWRMPNTSELLYLYDVYGVRGSTEGSLFLNVQADYPSNPYSSYWGISYLNNYNPPFAYSARMDFSSGTSNALATNAATLYAWAVRNGDVPAVPEPETYGMMLMGIGLIGFVVRRRTNAKNICIL
jgi:hypothetical protein